MEITSINDDDSGFLKDETVRNNLKTLGMHPILSQHVFLELSLSQAGLENIDNLSKFPHIMYLNLSKNKLRNLDILNKLPTLVQLDVSHNELIECLDFSAPLCCAQNSWQSGSRAAGSMLTMVNLANNKISKIKEMSSHQFLECLILRNNQVTTIEGITQLKFLKTLDLSHNLLRSISGLDNLPIRELNLSANCISSLTGLTHLAHLTTLSAAENQISTLSPISSCLALSYVDIRNNKLTKIRQTEFLREINWLHVLLLSGNPCCQKEQYRLRVLFRLPSLKRLDLSNVSAEEKIRACNLYQSPGGDLSLREQVHNKYIPDLQFRDNSPAQLNPFDDEMDLSIDELAQDGEECWRDINHQVATTYFNGLVQQLV